MYVFFRVALPKILDGLNHHADTGLGFWQSLLQRTNNNYNYNTHNIEILDKTTNKVEINPCTHK